MKMMKWLETNHQYEGTDADAGETMTFSLDTNPMSLFELTPGTTASTGATATVGLAAGNTLGF